MTTSSQDSIEVVGCSVRGPKHIEDDRPCQDSWAKADLAGDRFAIAVADGLGSADLSHKGSDLATNEAVDVLEETLSDVDQLGEEAIENAVREAISAARSSLINEAAETGNQVSDLSTTLLVAVGNPSMVGGAIVGDGGIVCVNEDSYKLLAPREGSVVDLPAAHVTVPLPHEEWQDSYRFGFVENHNGVAVFSDGLENFTWDGANQANSEFFDAAFNLVRNASDLAQATQDLTDALQKDPYERFGDDKTIALGIPADTLKGETEQQENKDNEENEKQPENPISGSEDS